MLKIGNKIPNNIFIGGKELSKIYKGETLIFNNKSIELTSLAGAFDVTVSGFVNPVWEYNGEIQNGNTGKFTILNDNDIVTLSWSSIENNTNFIVNSAGRSKFNIKLENLRKKITYFLNLAYCSQITGDLSDLSGKITYLLNLTNCSRITGIYTPINSSAVPSTIDLSNTGLNASDIDQTLNNISLTDKKNGKFTANGMTRTSVSDSAVEKLVSQGWTVSGITKTEV